VNEIIAAPLVNVIWVLVTILLVTALVNRTNRELLLALVVVLLIPAPLLTKLIRVQLVESTPMPLRVEHLPTPVATPLPPQSIPVPVIMPTQTFTEARSDSVYGYNPKPKYPRIARSSGWEGKVVLQIHVSADGDATGVSVSQSSGHDILDEAAVAAVEGWRFKPAKRGDTPVSSTVSVPINFKLD
jgi:TonB family protein